MLIGNERPVEILDVDPVDHEKRSTREQEVLKPPRVAVPSNVEKNGVVPDQVGKRCPLADDFGLADVYNFEQSRVLVPDLFQQGSSLVFNGL